LLLNVTPTVVKLRFRAIAQTDLAEIDTFSAERFGRDVADMYASGLIEAFSQIATFPRSGPARTDYGLHIRSKVYRSHRIIYVIDRHGDVEIYRVVHHSRDVPAALKP